MRNEDNFKTGEYIDITTQPTEIQRLLLGEPLAKILRESQGNWETTSYEVVSIDKKSKVITIKPASPK
jgi:hypothetical protein